jgi:hypothetical protein
MCEAKGEERPTLRGLVRGVLKTRPPGGMTPCVLFGDHFCSWLPFLGELGLRAALVVLKRDDSVSVVRRFVSNDCVVLVTDDWYGTLLPVRVGEAPSLGLTNGRINGTTLHLATRLGVKTVVGVGTPRAARHWSESRVAVSHAKVGGGRHELFNFMAGLYAADARIGRKTSGAFGAHGPA